MILIPDFDPIVRAWVSRIGFLTLLMVFVAASILDWLAEHKQMRILLKQAEVNNVPLARLLLHRLNNQIAILVGLSEVDCKQTDELINAQKDVTFTVQEIQRLVRSMDLPTPTTHTPSSENTSVESKAVATAETDTGRTDAFH